MPPEETRRIGGRGRRTHRYAPILLAVNLDGRFEHNMIWKFEL
jgi:hypothetical protein